MNKCLDIKSHFFPVLLILPLLFLSGCKDEWKGYVYPKKSDLTIFTKIGGFSSLEECRDVAISVLEVFGSYQIGDYECGYNCDNGKQLGDIEVCEKTSK